MRDKINDRIIIVGESVILKEISPEFFSYLIKWRNDKNLNKYINQKVELTMESQISWYENIYLKDDTQGLFVVVDKTSNTPIGTLGWTDMDYDNRRVVTGRMLLIDKTYAEKFLEACLLESDFLYQTVDIMYGHVVKDNKKALRMNKFLGYCVNTEEIIYPHELLVAGMEQVELFRNRETFMHIREKLYYQVKMSIL